MSLIENIRATVELVGDILFRAFVVGYVFLIVVGLPLLFLEDQVYSIHTLFMEMSKADHTLMMLTWMGNVKSLLFVFLLFPWLAIRWTLKKAAA
jgi:hypothetical protein